MYLSDFDEYEQPEVVFPKSPCHSVEMESAHMGSFDTDMWACPTCGLVYADRFVKAQHGPVST